MTKDPFYEQFRELGWRRKLTAAEEARLAEWLAAHPEAQEEWESEASLNAALQALPDVAVASNFTARAVEAARRESGTEYRRPGRSITSAWWFRWLPRAALAGVVLAAGLVSYNHLQEARRTEWAQSLETVSQVPSLPSPEVLKDYDAIDALSSNPPADEELLRAMQ